VTYYNEFDPFAAQWLENLVEAGHIVHGKVDSRSIVDVQRDDIPQGGQAHFFAGIGIWSLALRIAGIAEDANVWTGSCPCQPFSVAGKQQGEQDERHLWPEWRRLIEEHRPAVIFGEQVASPAGRDWLDAVRTDLEALGYEVGAADLCAAGVGAPHIRQRLFFGARLANSRHTRLERHTGNVYPGDQSGWHNTRSTRPASEGGEHGGMEEFAPGVVVHRYRGERCDWLLCREPAGLPVWRPVERGTFPMAYGDSGRVGRLRAYGNAIVPQVAAEFIQAFMEAL